MHFFVLRTLCAAVLAAGVVTALQAAPETPPAAPRIAPAKRLTFTPPPGTAWYLDGSSDGSTWTEMAGPFFANGAPVEHFQRAKDTSRQVRLRFVDPASIGHAPVSLAGTSVRMDNADGPVEVVFMNEKRGILRIDATHARSFTYTWLKQSPDSGEAILSGVDGTHVLLRLNFIDGHLGRWGMEEIASPEAASLIKDTLDAGAFTFRQGLFRRGPEKARLPSDFADSSMILNEAGRLTHLRFTGADTVVMQTGGVSTEGKYAYDPFDAGRGKLQLNPLNGVGLDLSLDLGTPGSGRFEEILPGGGTGPRSGTFTFPDEQAPPANPDCPPKDLTGLSIILNDSSPCTLIFNGDGTGVQSKDVDGAIEATAFNYTYSRTGGNSASVAITFPGTGSDLIDDYDLEFDDDCTGSFERKSYADGNARPGGGDQGTFESGGIALR
jgi:hypothetical protein